MKLYKSTFHIAQMDCPCEENLIRMKLEGQSSIQKLDFDLNRRELRIIHRGSVEEIAQMLESLSLGSSLNISQETDENFDSREHSKQRHALWIVLGINFTFFLIEIVSGLLSKSMGLLADSLDMLADSLVYGMSLLVVGAIASRKKRVALLSGILQMILAALGLLEVIRRFIGFEAMPEFRTMIGISLLALLANTSCLWILQRTKSKDAHMKASIIFSANDVIINLGVIVAGLLVWWSGTQLPDLIIGIIIFLIVMRGAIRILRLAF